MTDILYRDQMDGAIGHTYAPDEVRASFEAVHKAIADEHARHVDEPIFYGGEVVGWWKGGKMYRYDNQIERIFLEGLGCGE